MKIVVTGALGHIGSRLIRELPSVFPSAEIVMVDNLMTQRYCSLFNLPQIGRYQFIEADVTSMDLEPLLKGAHVVVHLAAITDATGSIDRADELERNNFSATKRLAQACAYAQVRLISLSSTSVYGSQADLVDENCSPDELQPQSPYAFTKLKEEHLVQELVAKANLSACICRFGTIFGVSPGMRFHTAVNKFCWQAAMQQPISVWKTAFDQKRPYLDIGDACRAITHIIKNNLFDGLVYNILTLNATVREVVGAIRDVVPDLEVRFVESRIMNQLSYEVNNLRFADTNFQVCGSMHNAIREEISWIHVNK
jgi:nucleoside-diphosphate-sugar epimerase